MNLSLKVSSQVSYSFDELLKNNGILGLSPFFSVLRTPTIYEGYFSTPVFSPYQRPYLGISPLDYHQEESLEGLSGSDEFITPTP